jgi:poly(hydroxyalkanoate) granule-associated protein
MTQEDTTAPPDDTVRAAPELDIARKIWLAGVGAYDRISSETQDVVGKLASSASETFEELVAKGEEVEERVRKSLARSPQAEKMNHAMETAAAKASEQRAALEARLAKVREAVSETLAPWNMPALGQALEKLAAKVDALSQEVAALRNEKAERAQEPPAAG